MYQSILRLLEPIARRVRAVVTTGTWRITYDGEGVQRGQVELADDGKPRDQVLHPQPYGFTSAPLAGAWPAVALRVGGLASQTLVIVVDDRRFRLQAMQDGEVALYDDQGSYVHLRRGGVIAVRAAGGLELEGNLSVQGDIEATGNVKDLVGTLADFRTKYNIHTHVETGANTGPPSPTA